MNCDDVNKAFNSDSIDLERVKRHLETCPECAQQYSSDLELETALLGLALHKSPVNIADEVGRKLAIDNRRRSRLNYIRKWTWITASLAVLLLLVATLPAFVDWLNTVDDSSSATLSELSKSFFAYGGKFQASIESSRYYLHFCYLMIITLGGVIAYLWREFDGIIGSSS